MTRARALRFYIIAIGLLAAAVVLVCIDAFFHMTEADRLHWLPYAGLFVGICLLCNLQRVYFSDSNVVTMGTMGQVACVVVLPLPVAILVAGTAKCATAVYVRSKLRTSWRSTVLNVSNTILAISAAAVAFHLLRGPSLLWNAESIIVLSALPAVAALGLFTHVADNLVVTGAITLNSGERPGAVFMRLLREAIMPELSLIAVGVIFAILFHFSPVLSIFIVVPVYLSTKSFGAVARLRKETIEAVLKMAESIDYRDTGTYEHSERLADYSQRLSIKMGLTPEHVREVVLAARVHDLGKIGISNDILLKQGPLSMQERQTMEEHPIIGATILSSYSSFKESVDIVRHHHERWDGKGYPGQLQGDEIPIGSRIITVVDSFDAMTSDRPYRKGMSAAEAVGRLKDAMGTQFDARVCATFIQILMEDGTFVPESEASGLRLMRQDVG